MPRFASGFQQNVASALDIARAGDIAGATPLGSTVRQVWHVSRVELLYELAYLRMFNEWESFLEQTFIRYMCGYISHAAVSRLPAHEYTNIAAATAAVLQGRAFKLWHDPNHVANRARGFFSVSPHDLVISSHQSRLSDFAAVRHRIAHAQEDASRKFATATMRLAGVRYRANRPGRFLRDWDNSVTPARRWLDTIGGELKSLARQIA